MTAAGAPKARSRIEAWFDARPTWQRSLLALAAGACAVFGHAPFHLVPVFAASLVVLLWLLDAAARRPGKHLSALLTGWLFGLGYFGFGLHWVASAFLVESQIWGPGWGIAAATTLAAVLALYWGLGCAVAIAFWTRDFRRIAVFAACLFATEWLRGHLFGGFPWLLPGYVWMPGEPVSQVASVVGIYGLSLLTLLVLATPAALADGGVAMGRRFAPVLATALLVGLGWGWGAQRLAQAPVEAPGAQPVVRVADSGLSQGEKWRNAPDQEWRVLQRYLAASGAADESRAGILIWPEGAIPTVNFFLLEHAPFVEAIGRALGDRALILGLTRREADQTGIHYFNSAAIIDGVNGRARLSEQIYDKHRLVPFGEMMPFEDFVRSLNIPSLQQVGAYFTPGAPPSRLVVPGAKEAVALICYEAIFPGMIPGGPDRPGWIVSVTNDAWFGGGIGPRQHYAAARYRTIETGLPMARAASGGVSAIIDSFGREVSSTSGGGLWAEGQIPPALPETPMARMGMVWLLLLIALVGAMRFVPLSGRWSGEA
jgi:apolipoprotein N-acyltransferase